MVAMVETIQYLYWCFGTELGMRPQNKSVADDRAAAEASERHLGLVASLLSVVIVKNGWVLSVARGAMHSLSAVSV